MSDTALTDLTAIDYARRNCVPELSNESAERLRQFASVMDSIKQPDEPPALNIFVFHTSVESEQGRVEAVNIDHSAFDYHAILQHFFSIALSFNPKGRIIFITSEHEPLEPEDPRIQTVRLPLRHGFPMFERALCMAAYVSSTLFNADTAFLDSDAFVNRPLAPIFLLDFDLALTFRETRPLMPLNEGVIFASSKRREKVREFFTSYIASYDAITVNSRLNEHFGDVRRWRGGQLSLNMLACPIGLPSEIDKGRAGNAAIRYLDSRTYNFWIQGGRNYAYETLVAKYILHLKGTIKDELGQVREIQLAWLNDLKNRLNAPA